MNYYPFHLGDYAAHTAHLEPMEDLAYRRMLDLYYLREAPLPAEPSEVARLIRMRANVADVEAVLREFFTLADDGWRHARCDAELVKMQDKQAKAKASAQASVNARLARQTSERPADVERTLNERSTDVELPTPTPTPTPTPEPKTKTARKRAAPAVLVSVSDLVAEGVEERTATDWLVVRKAKSLPLTPTAWDEVKAEAVKAGISAGEAVKAATVNGWGGFKAVWLQQPVRNGPVSAFDRKAAEASKWMTVTHPLHDFDFVDMEAPSAVAIPLR